jgi:dTDP-4-dehydrorhamnose reductase
MVARLRPEAVIHTAAVTNPDRCEIEPEAALRVNFQATAELAQAAGDLGCRVIFISTDLVFDGRQGHYKEEDEARPLSVYGTSKLRAEEAVLAASSSNVVLRSALLYGYGSPANGTFLTGLSGRLEAGEKVRLFTDQMRTPVTTTDLADAIIIALEKDLSGLFHVGGAESISRYDFGIKVCRVFGYDRELLEPILMADFDYVARRPLDTTFDITKFSAASGLRPSSVEAGLRKIREQRPPGDRQRHRP